MSTPTPRVLSPLKAAKKKLRSEMDAKLALLSEAEVAQQSKAVHEQLFALPEFVNAKRVGLYLSLPSGEVDTIAILEVAFAQGKQCFVPKYRPRGRVMEFVELHSMADYEAMPVEPKWRIKQPDPNDETRADALTSGGLDVLLVPGVAFTPDGTRLGHGMGYFDTWQSRCAATVGIQHPVTVALALREQIVDQLPADETDIRIHKVLYAK